ncbi:MAG: benzoyl-CoA reductase subunit C [Bdellovibrionota bacterium]
MSVRSIIERCEELCRDLDFKYVVEWKKAHSAKAIGYMPVYVPREIIHAAGMLPVGIMGGGDEIEIIRGDAYFQSYICRIPRSTIELGVCGKLDSLDGMLFPAICDVIRNLSGMWKVMFPGKYVKYIDFPQDYNDAGKSFYESELRRLCDDLSGISGVTVTDEALRNSIKLYNENRAAIDELYRLRSRLPHQVTTYETYVIMRASNILEVSEHTKLVHEYIGAIKEVKRPERDHVRVIVSGAFCEQPPLNLIKALESSGCYIVDDDWVLCSRYFIKDISEDGDPFYALAESYIRSAVSTASRYEEGKDKGQYLLRMVRERQAEGVVFAAPSFCDPALLERPMLQAVLSEHNIPYTGFKYAENTGQIQVIKEETGTFADSIKLWGTK